MVFKGHEKDPEPLAAAWFRLTGSHTIPLPYALPKARSLGLLGVPGRDEDLAFGT